MHKDAPAPCAEQKPLQSSDGTLSKHTSHNYLQEKQQQKDCTEKILLNLGMLLNNKNNTWTSKISGNKFWLWNPNMFWDNSLLIKDE